MSILVLPEALQPWRPWLSWFGPHLAEQLGTLIRTLAPLMGHFRGAVRPGVPEPDGFDDLRRRGSYERLLGTEWLLATEMPEEFLRRAAGGEHLFLHPRPRDTQVDRLIVALFDAGPWQTGAARLAHLALWILLARRAEQAKGELRWGVLQQPGVLHPAASAADLRTLLGGRTWTPGTGDHAEHWARAFEEQRLGIGECWRIGSRDGALQAPSDPVTHDVRIVRTVDADALEVTLRDRGSRRAVRLALPSIPAGSALLKGRFDGESQPGLFHRRTSVLSTRIAPVIAPLGNHVAVTVQGEPGALVFRVPQATDKKAQQRRQLWGAAHEPIGAAFCGKRFGAVLRDGDVLRFWQMPQLGTAPCPETRQFAVPPGTASWRPTFWLRTKESEYVHVLDAQARLVYWARDRSAAPNKDLVTARGPMLLDEGVLSAAQIDPESLVYARSLGDQLSVHTATGAARQLRHHDLGRTPPHAVVYFTDGSKWKTGFGTCAVRRRLDADSERWTLYEAAAGPWTEFHSFTSSEVSLDTGHRAIGLVRDPRAGRVGLVVLTSDRRRLLLQSASVEVLHHAAHPIARISVCPNTGLVALLTAHELILYHVHDRTVRLVVQDQEAS